MAAPITAAATHDEGDEAYLESVPYGASTFTSGIWPFCFYVQVEYMPVSSLEQSRAAVLEFMELWQEGVILGQFVALELNFTDFSLSDHYCWQHTALQYVSLMAFFLSQQRTWASEV